MSSGEGVGGEMGGKPGRGELKYTRHRTQLQKPLRGQAGNTKFRS